MSATTRWNLYDVASAGTMGLGTTSVSGGGLGTRGYSLATASTSDKFNIGSTNDQLYINIDGAAVPYITLASGSDLDPRFVAKDITEKLHNAGGSEGKDHAQCAWENNHFKLYSGTFGSSSTATVISGAVNNAHVELGWSGHSESGGSDHGNTYNGGITVSGTYNGFFDELYRVVINLEPNVGATQKQTSATANATSGGSFNHVSDITYAISIDVTHGSTMGSRTGNVPTMTWTSTGGADDSTASVELLYPNFWYQLGTKGVMIQFTDGVFDTYTDAWTVACTYSQYVVGTTTNAAVGTAKYVWGSSRGDDCTVAQDTVVGWNAVGTRGIYIKFNGSNNLSAGDEFYILATPPKPQSYGITTLNYGNVTVSTESPVKCVFFEIMSGAVEISTVKFGLQNHGSFTHHDIGDDDTKFRFGTVGPDNHPLAPTGAEWRASVTASDISSDLPPSYLFATKEDLAVVADADASESIGSSTFAGMCADPIWVNIKLGASEVGSNSQINMRAYFDYS